jgi:pyridoxal phosphate enzyme (YggS family)
MVPVARIEEAIAAGQCDFGENYVQEARDKMLATDPGVRWHYIGRLQTNKAKYVVGRYALVHAVDRVELAAELSKRAVSASVVQPVLIEVRLDPAETKGGVEPSDVPALAEAIGGLAGLRLQGLMGMPPYASDPSLSRPYYSRLREMLGSLPPEARQILSMGMSGDFEVAIEEGATIVRVGTAIFGHRTAAPG